MTPFSALRRQTGLSIQEVAREMGFDERTVYRWESGDTSPRKPIMELLRKKVADKASAGTGVTCH